MGINDFKKNLKIGIQTKGYEDFVGNNLLLCIGFLGRCTSSSSTHFKLKTEDVVHLIGNKGVKLLKPLKFSPDLLAGLDWNLQFKENKTINPEDSIMYTDTKGNVNIRFTNYVSGNQDDTSSEASRDYNQDLVNLEIEHNTCTQEKSLCLEPRVFEVGLTKLLYPKELELKLTERELLYLEKDLLHRKTLAPNEYLFYDTQQNIRIGVMEAEKELLTDSDSDKESLQTNLDSLKDMMDTEASSPYVPASTSHTYHGTPTHQVYSSGNMPRIPYTEITELPYKVRPKGKRRELEKPVKFQELGKGKILNLSAHDPQEWASFVLYFILLSMFHIACNISFYFLFLYFLSIFHLPFYS